MDIPLRNIFHVLMLNVLITHSLTLCPSDLCYCDNSVIDCTKKLIDRIPIFKRINNKTYNKIDLSGNQMYMIPHYAFENLQVKEIYVSGNPLEGISPRAFSGIENSLEILDLHDTNLFVIHWAVFDRLEKLKKLNLSSNRLFALQKELFQNLHSLTHLDLSWNTLKRLSAESFQELDKLEVLKLQGNAIYSIDDSSFGNLRHLESLVLSSNQLSVLHPLVFRGLERLLELDLSDNLLTEIPTEAFKQMPKLNVLRMDQNNITEILSSESFATASQLETLTLSYNNIANISSESLWGLSSISKLDLSSNQIESIGNKNCKVEYAAAIKHLMLDGNPLRCNCVISWIGEIIDKTKGSEVSGTCASPDKYMKLPISRVDFSMCETQRVCSHSSDNNDLN